VSLIGKLICLFPVWLHLPLNLMDLPVLQQSGGAVSVRPRWERWKPSP